jgi:hypothetical protein
LTVKGGDEKYFSRFEVFLPRWKILVGLWWEHFPELREPTNGKKGAAAPLQALCGTFTPTAALSSEAVLRRMDISFSKLTRFNTRLRL